MFQSRLQEAQGVFNFTQSSEMISISEDLRIYVHGATCPNILKKCKFIKFNNIIGVLLPGNMDPPNNDRVYDGKPTIFDLLVFLKKCCILTLSSLNVIFQMSIFCINSM